MPLSLPVLLLAACCQEEDVAPDEQVEAAVHDEIATIVEVTWTEQAESDSVWLEFSFEDDDWRSTPARPGTKGEHREVLLGIPAETQVEYRIVREVDGEAITSDQSWTATTGPLPLDGLQPDLLVHDPLLASPEEWVLGTIEINDTDYYQGPFWMFVLDRQGRVVWYLPIEEDFYTLYPRVARSGDHLVYEESVIFTFSGAVGGIVRSSLDRTQYERTDLPGMCLTFAETGDGAFVYDKCDEWPEIEMAEYAADGTERILWNCSDWISIGCASFGCCSPNAIRWVAETDTVLWSMWLPDSVVEVERQTGEVTAVWGQLPESWTFDPPEAVFEMQHWPGYTPDGNLLISTHILGDEGEQRIREFRLDDETETLVEVWSYGEGVNHYAIYHGEGTRLDNGNTFINYGTDGVIREVDAEGRVAWDVAWSEPWMLGHTLLVDDLYALNEGWQ